MYSLTIHFGPSMMVWALLFKTEAKAAEAYNAYIDFRTADGKNDTLIGSDDFGQAYAIPMNKIHGMMLEDLDLIETARIQRALAEERCKVKLMTAARSDPVIGPAARGQSPGVLTPMGGGFRG